MKIMRRNFAIVSIALLMTFVAGWSTVAVVRLKREHSALIYQIEQDPELFWYTSTELRDFTAKAHLQWNSLGQLLKRPWRDDVRLYFDYRGAYAARYGDESWVLKWQ